MSTRGHRIAVVTALVSVAGTLTLASAASATFPGSNGRIAYLEDLPPYNVDQIFTIESNGAGAARLTDTEENLDPAYSANGERIVFSRNPAGAPDPDIWVMSHDGSGQTQLTSDPVLEDTEPAFSPDGSRIVFQRDIAGDDQVFVMNADGSGATQLTFPGPGNDEGFEPSFSPDGRTIVFRRNDGVTNFNEIYLMNPDGSGQRQVTTGSAAASDSRPDFSPDGNRVIFQRSDGGGNDVDIFSVSLVDGSLLQLTDGPARDFDPTYSPDGTRIAFERESPPGFLSGDLTLAGSSGLNQNVTTITTQPASNDVYFYNPSWQPLNPPACDLSGAAKSKSYSQITVTAICTNDNVSAVLSGAGKAPKPPRGALISKKKKFQIPAVTTQLPEGTATSIVLKISKKGKKALKKAAKAGKKGKATVTATFTDDLGQTSQDTFDVTFKPKR